MGSSGSTLLIQFLQAAILSVIGIIIFLQPVLGIAVIVGSLPVATLLPPVSFASSMFSMFGGITLAGYIYHDIIKEQLKPAFTLLHFCSLLFIVWIVASNPVAAISTGNRVWLWTYLQLFIFMFLTTQLLKRESDYQLLMWTFVITTIVSALSAIQQVKFGISSESSLRALGLAYNPNESGRYFVIAIVFLLYLRHKFSQISVRIVSIVAIVILFVGIASTVSRTSILLLWVAFGMMALEHSSLFKDRLFEFIAAIVAAALLLIPAEYWQISSGILSSIISGNDSVGFRYMQWDAGLAMWADHPIAGVGVGSFRANTTFYGTNFLPFYGIRYAPHSTYIALLAETGIVGFLLFLTMIGVCIAALLKVSINDRSERQSSSPYYAWLTVLVILLVGGITGDEQFSKIVWMILGIGGIALSSTRKAPAKE